MLVFDHRHQIFYSNPITNKGMVNILYHFFWDLSINLQKKERCIMFTENIVETIDDNNTKALELTHLIITTLENGIEDGIDIVSNLEIVRDILKSNSAIFDRQGV